jgi:hypothetical protein
VLAVVLVSELALLLVFLVPFLAAADAADGGASIPVNFLGLSGSFTAFSAFIVLSLAAGAVGGALHGIASLTAHVAEGDFEPRWALWYLTNPLVGAALATIFLFVLQAGLGGQTASAAPASLYGVAAVATLSGLFSRHALDKLKHIFDVAFASPGGTAATTAVASVADGPPSIHDVKPRKVDAGETDVPILILGAGFDAGCVVAADGTQVPPTTVDAGSIAVALPGAVVSQPRILPLRVRSAAGVWSNEAELEVS